MSIYMFVDISHIQGIKDIVLAQFIVDLINWVISFSAVLSVIMIVSAGFQYIFSFGDPKKIGKATSSLIFALIGMVLVFLSPSVIQFVLDNFLSRR